MREKLEKEVRELKTSLDARQVELRNRAAEAQSAENVLKDYEQQIRDLHVRPFHKPALHRMLHNIHCNFTAAFSASHLTYLQAFLFQVAVALGDYLFDRAMDAGHPQQGEQGV